MEVQRRSGEDKESTNKTNQDDELPQCKIKRNYSCNHCTYFTQNPRFHLTHLRDIHGERIVINKCNLCLYASRHYQKLVRHMKMVHGSTEGITGQSRKRASVEDSTWSQQQKKILLPPEQLVLLTDETPIDFANLSNDLELSRNSLKDIAALYFAENQIDTIMTQMEEADAVQLPVEVQRKTAGSSFFDELKKSIVEEANLNCTCGYVSKCFSEYVIHRNSCSCPHETKYERNMPLVNLSSGSTRCQHCRRRCKSSMDLLNHLKNCLEEESPNLMAKMKCERQEPNDSGGHCPKPVENRMYLWNKAQATSDVNVTVKSEIVGEETKQQTTEGADFHVANYLGKETAKDNVEVTKNPSRDEEASTSLLKKVFKCPRCSFWASTASRFHVHIVGHLKKKPFMCSLCAYCSNWRWDITKHIRLKTIRDPSHRNAQVLMNDETGRFNYSKYNKYITLMKVTDEDGDPKLMKSGEMTPMQVASLEFLNGFNKSGLHNTDLKIKHSQDDDLLLDHDIQCNEQNDVTDTNGFMRLPFLASAMMNVAIAQKVQQQQQQTVVAATEEIKDSTCYFTHANRDTVLDHVKVHYHDPQVSFPSPSKPNNSTPLHAAINSTNLYMNNVLAAAMCLSQKQLLQEGKSPSGSKLNNKNSILSPVASAGDFQQHLSPKNLILTQSAGNAIELRKTDEESSSLTALCASPSESLAVVEVNTDPSIEPSSTTIKLDTTSSFIGDARQSGMLMDITSSSFGKATNEIKVPSPFRCGHCHQESNWKHVIQRHCRLKHSSYIRIEAFDRNSDGCTPVYRPLQLCRNGGQLRLDLIKNPHPYQQQPTNSNITAKNDLRKKKNKRNSEDFSSNSDQDLLTNSVEVTQLPLKSNLTSKKFKCPSCPYISNSKSQLNYHISLHKPTQYECNLCPYTSTKKLGLSNHVKTHAPPAAYDYDDDAKPMQSHEDGKPSTVDGDKDGCEYSAPSLQQVTLLKPDASPLVVADKDKKLVRNISNLVNENAIQKKCTCCPFKSVCHKSLQRHLQSPVRVDKGLIKHTCDQCDFSTISECKFAEHIRAHLDSRKSEKLEPIATDSDDRKDELKSMHGVTNVKPTECNEKTEEEMHLNLRHSRRASALRGEKKSPLPSSGSNHKTILVNPKTGQVIRRN